MSLLDRITPGEWKLKFHAAINPETLMYWANAKTSIGTGNHHDARLMGASAELYRRLRALYEAIPHNGEPGSALRRECEATKALIHELESGHA